MTSIIGDVSRAEHIYIVYGYTDMRKVVDGLAAIVQQNFQLDVFLGNLFLFCEKRCDRIKALLWEEDGSAIQAELSLDPAVIGLLAINIFFKKSYPTPFHCLKFFLLPII